MVMSEEERKEKKREYQRKYREKHREAIKERRRKSDLKYREKHREEIRKSIKKFKEDNPEKVSAYKRKSNKKYAENNREKLIKCASSYRERHREEERERARVNRELKPEYQKKYRKHRYETDFDFRLRCALRSRLRVALKTNNIKKEYETFDLIGCSIKHLKDHLSSQFKDGMSFDNYGEWQIDHKIPCASFDLTIPENQKKCFHYSNLQPLWAKDNMLKGAKILEEFKTQLKLN